MNNLFRSLSEERQAGLKRVIGEARRTRRPQSEMLRDQSQACASPQGNGSGGVNWQLKTDECGVLAQGVWPKDVRL